MRKNAKRHEIIKGRGLNKRSNLTISDKGYELQYYKAPKSLSFINNFDESIRFFDNINKANDSIKKPKHYIDMIDVVDLTMETVLYLTSQKNIWKKQKHKFKLEIKAPRETRLRSLLSKSGLDNYFQGNHKGIVETNIYPMCDGGEETLDDSNSMTPNDRCISISDFTKNILSKNGEVNKRDLVRKVFAQTNAIAEMIRNTEDHAYNKNANPFTPLRNWYFFAAKVQNGVSFYFLDNGKGVINTTKKFIIDTIFLGFQDVDQKLLQEIMEGNFRSRTELPYRNKGLPEIKEFFECDDVLVSRIITNKVVYSNDMGKISYNKMKREFQGTLYIWILKEDYINENINA